MFNPVLFLYELLLRREVARTPIPVNHLLLVIDDTDLLADTGGMERLRSFTRWCHSLKIPLVSVYISVIQDRLDSSLFERVYAHLKEELPRLLSKEKTSLVLYADDSEPEAGYAKIIGAGDTEQKLYISLGFTGRRELTKAVQEIAKKVQRGELEPEAVDEKLIESELIFKSEPDLVIRSGATRLTDFLIWQSVYTEFYFTDVNWAQFRKIDLLRAIRDFKMRERRFGR
ncbi:MAG: hypothetical protein EFT35_07645 [Methanophagales archaeon ANME-1-THS]|nr:MAG: hypothetical protein EFT35_07645 [Methanophagales archaeon ANME-1-THS]